MATSGFHGVVVTEKRFQMFQSRGTTGGSPFGFFPPPPLSTHLNPVFHSRLAAIFLAEPAAREAGGLGSEIFTAVAGVVDADCARVD